MGEHCHIKQALALWDVGWIGKVSFHCHNPTDLQTEETLRRWPHDVAEV